MITDILKTAVTCLLPIHLSEFELLWQVSLPLFLRDFREQWAQRSGSFFQNRKHGLLQYHGESQC